MHELPKLCADLRAAQIECLRPSCLPPDIVKRLSEIPVAARLYERRTARCVYRRASVTSAEGEPLVRLSDLRDALVVALVPPTGWVLMPVKLPEPMLDVLWSAEADMRDADMQDLWSALIAARPKVP